MKEIIKAGGVGAIPFRPEFFEEKEKREILKDIFETLFSEGENVVEGKDGEDVRK